MEDTASHETVYKLAHRVNKANFSWENAPTILGKLPASTGFEAVTPLFWG